MNQGKLIRVFIPFSVLLLVLPFSSALSLALNIRHSEFYNDRSTNVPVNVSLMKGIYEPLKRFYDAEKHGELVQNVSLVMGVFSMRDKEDANRQVIKDTWMKQKGVCWISQGQNPSCNVYVAFVVGGKDNQHQPNVTNGLITKREGMDELSLNLVENMNNGKSLEWLKFASNAYKWASHVGKMDMDTYPHFEKITTQLSKKSSCASFSGWPIYPMNLENVTEEGKRQRDPNLDVNEREYYPEKLPTNCIISMQGGLYILSRDLARGATESIQQLNGHEDQMVGFAVKLYAQDKKICLANHLQKVGFHHFSGQWGDSDVQLKVRRGGWPSFNR